MVKQTFLGLFRTPSNYGIDRTTWIMSDLTRVLTEMDILPVLK